jgi:histidyl-tRNA synthetase
MGYADSIEAETVVIVGERDLADGVVTLKDMKSGDQTQAPLDSFPPSEGRPTYEDFEG